MWSQVVPADTRMLHRHRDLRPVGSQRPKIDDLGAVSVDDSNGASGIDTNGTAVATRHNDAWHVRSPPLAADVRQASWRAGASRRRRHRGIPRTAVPTLVNFRRAC